MAQAVDEAGNIWEVDAQGNPVRFLGKQGEAAQPSRIITKPAQPKEAPSGYRWGANGELIAIPGGPADKPTDDPNAPKLPTGYRWRPDGSAELIPGVAAPGAGNKATAAQRTEAIQGFNDAVALRKIAAQLRERFEQGPGATQGIAAIQDFLPTAANRGFDSAAQRARGYVKRSLGFTGGEGNTVAESTTLYDPYLPSTSDYDSSILDKIAALEELAGFAEGKAVAVLGGRPDASGNVIPVMQDQQMPMLAPAGNVPPTQQGPDRSAPLPTGPSFGGPDPDASGFVPYGSTQRRINNPEWAGVNDVVKGMIIAGQSPEQIKAYLGQRGINQNVDGLNQAIQYYRKTGKQDFRVNVDDVTVPMSGVEQFRNNAPQTRLGTAATTFANAMGVGIPQALAPEQMQYLRDQNPVSAFAGDVGGIVSATSAIGKVGGNIVGRYAPGLLTSPNRVASAVRAVGPDAVYGATYGGITEGDPLTGAATAAAGSGVGQLIGKGFQKTLQGVTDPAVQYLTARGVPLSLGETLGNNSIVGRQMQRMESIPFLGDLMSARRGEARDAVYRGVLEDAVQPIGGRIDPADPLASAQQAVSSAYDNAVKGVSVPLSVGDGGIYDGIDSARVAAMTLPPDLQAKFNAAIETRVNPVIGRSGSVEDVPLSSIRKYEEGDLSNPQVNYEFATGNVFDNPAPIKLTRLKDGTPYLMDGYHRTNRAQRLGKETIKGEFGKLSSVDVERLAREGVEPELLPEPGYITGQEYQQAMRGLSGYKSEATKPGFEQDYRDAISMVQGALKAQMMRGGGDTVVTGLRNADQAYSMLKPIEAATIAARGTPTPKQLLGAFTNNTKKYGGTAAAARGDKVPDIVRYAAENAPNIGNSGTADRLAGIMPFIMPTALGGTAVGLETFTDSPITTGALATLAALSTRTGQRAAQAALTKRPAAIRRVGGMFGSRKARQGLAGMVTAPLLIED